MTTEKKIAMLADIMEMEEDELTLDIVLDDLENWDSMTKLSLFVLFEDEFGKKITTKDVRGFQKVSDIIELME